MIDKNETTYISQQEFFNEYVKSTMGVSTTPVAVYDEDGEWVESEGTTCSGEWYDYDLPNKTRYFTADRQTGTLIDEFDSYAQAEIAIQMYEEQDKKEGIFEPNFYSIVDEEHCTLYE